MCAKMNIIRQELKNGVVINSKGNYLWVVFDGSCKTEEKCHAGCGGCSSSKPALRKKIATNKAQFYSVGQKITLKQYILNENIAVFVVFGIPLLMAILCSVSWYLYNPLKIESPLALLTTGLAFMAGFLIVWTIDTLFRKKFPPAIISNSPDESGNSQKQERFH